ncbi:hypothetical protein SCUCBS95973_001227 [Sporothrix curviconia]|uniref:Uncharacterized protein n=1 Tax=Sporothrix curviconia TaxID=1260050 RepID=A0ABP0AX19_9PEZI
MGNHAVVETPVRPAALLSFILARCTHPTTLIVCSSSADFVQRCAHDDYYDGDGCTEPLHTASLLQVAVARHVRVAFVPTVAHLRSFLAAFNLAASRMPPPPVVVSSGSNSSNDNDPERLSVSRGDRALVVYDFVRLHKGTSEWSGQGLGASTAVLAEAGWRTGLDVLVVESGAPVTGETPDAKQETVLDTRAPVLTSRLSIAD